LARQRLPGSRVSLWPKSHSTSRCPRRSAQVPTTSTTAHPVDQVRKWEDVTIETLPESLTLQDPSRGLCPAQTSGSPMTLKPAFAAASATFKSWRMSKLRAFGAPANAASTPTLKHPKHGNDRRFYFPDLLRAACHFCDHLPGNTPLQDVVTSYPALLGHDSAHAGVATTTLRRRSWRRTWQPKMASRTPVRVAIIKRRVQTVATRDTQLSRTSERELENSRKKTILQSPATGDGMGLFAILRQMSSAM